MFLYSARKEKIDLTPLSLNKIPTNRGGAPMFAVSGAEDSSRLSGMVTRASHAMFEMTGPEMVPGRRQRPLASLPTVFREQRSGCLRVVFKEIVIRFKSDTSSATRRKLLKKYGFSERSHNAFIPDQSVVFHRGGKYMGGDLLDVANDWAETDDVVFATPNFVSEYRRAAAPSIHPEQWHLRNRGKFGNQVKGEDVDAFGAWKHSEGKPGVVVAVVDDGVDIDHPNLKSRVLKNPDPQTPNDKFGRDFFVPESSPDHFDPRPKVFNYPYHQLQGNDIHGTPCAGVIASAGSLANVRGIAFRCRILPVKIFHADSMASDARVADAIRYSAIFADVVSCSWGGPWSPDIELAVQDAASGRGGKGTAIFCAAGNDYGNPVSYPARLPEAIAVGASTDRQQLASYSNVGSEISIVAPSSGGVRGIYITDVSYPNRGFNTGNTAAGSADGAHTNDFGGTSSATPLAAGIGALLLSVNPGLDRTELKEILERTADKIGSGYNANGHSKKFGYGRVNAKNAIAEAIRLKNASSQPTTASTASPSKRRRRKSFAT